MPELLPWLAAVVSIGMAVVPVLWYGITLYRNLLDKMEDEGRRDATEREALRLDVAKLRQELYGVNGDNGLKGRVAVLGDRTHMVPTLRQIMEMIAEEHEHKRRGE